MRTLEQITAEKNKIKARLKKIAAERDRLHKREYELDAETLRVKLAHWIGKPVRMAVALPKSNRFSVLNNQVGTLLSVRRTRATVEWPGGRKVTHPIDGLHPDTGEYSQGWVLELKRS